MEIVFTSHAKLRQKKRKITTDEIIQTINFPNNATEDDIRHAYMLAYKMKCKGLTVYRDGSREEQVLTHDEPKEGEKVPLLCEECESPVIMEDGCMKCSDPECGWSECKVG